MQQRRELGALPVAGIEPEPVGDRQDQLHDVAAVAAGVLVVRLEHVAEQERCAAVGAAELQRVLDPHLALAREHGDQPEQRNHEQPTAGNLGAGASGHEANWGE